MTLEAARRGSRVAQAALLWELQDAWYRLCLGLLGNADDARDAVQETALRFLRDLARFRGESSIATWSMGIAVNVTREIRRKRGLVLEDRDEQQFPRLQSETSSPQERAALAESSGLLRSTLDTLPDRQREALLLRYFENLSVEETARTMNCAAGTVKATVHQALRALRTKLKQLT